MRHAKSARPHGVPDHDRPLAGRGRRDAQAAGRWFLQEGPAPDLALCSTAVRARHTWEIVALSLPGTSTRLVPDLYGAGPDGALEVLRRAPDAAQVLLVVAHEPTLSELTLTLAGQGSDEWARHAVGTKFATSGIAVLRHRGAWRSLVAASCVLEAFVAPRG